MGRCQCNKSCASLVATEGTRHQAQAVAAPEHHHVPCLKPKGQTIVTSLHFTSHKKEKINTCTLQQQQCWVTWTTLCTSQIITGSDSAEKGKLTTDPGPPTGEVWRRQDGNGINQSMDGRDQILFTLRVTNQTNPGYRALENPQKKDLGCTTMRKIGYMYTGELKEKRGKLTRLWRTNRRRQSSC